MGNRYAVPGLSNDLIVRVTGAYPSTILRLAAPAIDSHQVTFGRTTVTPKGLWDPSGESAVVYYGHNAPIRIPKASAALLISR